jgi:hypothetical protein
MRKRKTKRTEAANEICYITDLSTFTRWTTKGENKISASNTEYG